MGLAVWNPPKVADCFSPRSQTSVAPCFMLCSGVSQAMRLVVADCGGTQAIATVANRHHRRRVPMPLQRRRSKWKRNDRPSDRIHPGRRGPEISRDDQTGLSAKISKKRRPVAHPFHGRRGEICVSRVIRNNLRHRSRMVFEDLSEQLVKNIAHPVRAFRLLGAR